MVVVVVMDKAAHFKFLCFDLYCHVPGVELLDGADDILVVAFGDDDAVAGGDAEEFGRAAPGNAGLPFLFRDLVLEKDTGGGEGAVVVLRVRVDLAEFAAGSEGTQHPVLIASLDGGLPLSNGFGKGLALPLVRLSLGDALHYGLLALGAAGDHALGHAHTP